MLGNIKKLRQEFGLSQSALAEQLGVSQQSVNKYENHNIEPDIRTLILIAEVFGTTVDYVVGRANARTPLSQTTPEGPMTTSAQNTDRRGGWSLQHRKG